MPGLPRRSARVLAAAALACGAILSGGAAAHAVGEIVPFVTAADIDGREVRLGELVATRRVALLFWDWRRATSIRALNLLEQLRARYRSRGLEVLAIEGEGSSREAVAERVEKLRSIGTGIPAPVIPDPGGRIARQFRVDSTPQLFLLNGAGRVAFHLVGFRSEDEQAVADAVRELVGDVSSSAGQPLVPARRTVAEQPPAAPPPPPRKEPEDPRRSLLERHRYFGGYYFNRREYAKAEESLRKYLELAPEDVEAWLRLGETLARRQAYDQAREAWEQALRLDPGNAEADTAIRKLIRGEY